MPCPEHAAAVPVRPSREPGHSDTVMAGEKLTVSIVVPAESCVVIDIAPTAPPLTAGVRMFWNTRAWLVSGAVAAMLLPLRATVMVHTPPTQAWVGVRSPEICV